MSSEVDDNENNLAIGNYELSLLSPDQTYNVVAYHNGQVTVGGSEKYFYPKCVAFRWNDLDIFPDTPLNLELTTNTIGIGTVSGSVSVEGDVAEDFPLVITIYTELNCSHPEGEDYIELTKVAEITDSGNNVFEYQVNLPLYDSEVTYYVVASAEGFIPDTGQANLTEGGSTDTVDLVLSPGE
jgi:hypothetical protein